MEERALRFPRGVEGSRGACVSRGVEGSLGIARAVWESLGVIPIDAITLLYCFYKTGQGRWSPRLRGAGAPLVCRHLRFLQCQLCASCRLSLQ